MHILLEIGPVIIFFIVAKFWGIIYATASIVITTPILVLANYFIFGKISQATLLSSLLVIILGGITLATGDPIFIKMKPTIVFSIFGLILAFGLYKKRIFIGNILKDFNLNEEQLIKISRLYCYFFFFCALLNEIVWRNFSDEIWINFKLFGINALMIAFTSLIIFRISK